MTTTNKYWRGFWFETIGVKDPASMRDALAIGLLCGLGIIISLAGAGWLILKLIGSLLNF